MTPHQQAVFDEVSRLAQRAKSLIESDWISPSREELFDKALQVRSTLQTIDQLMEEGSRFIDFTFHGRTHAERVLEVMLRLKQPLHTPRDQDHNLIAILDVETTGLTEHDEAITVGALLVEVKKRKGDFVTIVDSYYGMREPTVPISAGAQAVHGISIDVLRGTSFDLAALQKITDSASLLVAHNAKFDRRMLAKELDHVVHLPWACSIHSLKYEWAKLTGGQRSLDAICRCLSVSRQTPHNALSDCHALLEVLKLRAGATNRSSTLMGRLIAGAWAPPP